MVAHRTMKHWRTPLTGASLYPTWTCAAEWSVWDHFLEKKHWNHVTTAQTHVMKGFLTIRCRLEAVSSQGMRGRDLRSGDGTITFWSSGGKEGPRKMEVKMATIRLLRGAPRKCTEPKEDGAIAQVLCMNIKRMFTPAP